MRERSDGVSVEIDWIWTHLRYQLLSDFPQISETRSLVPWMEMI